MLIDHYRRKVDIFCEKRFDNQNMLAFFAHSAAAFNTTVLLYSEFSSMLYNDFGGLASFDPAKKICVQYYDVSDRQFNQSEYDIYQVHANWKQIDYFKEWSKNITIEDFSQCDVSYHVEFISKWKVASYGEMSTFWVSLVTMLIFVFAVIISIGIWTCDHYENDPANSLMFATEGQKLATGN